MVELTAKEVKDICNRVAKLTDSNQHGESIQYLCGRLGYDNLHSVIKEINKMHDVCGYITSDLIKIRSVVFTELFLNIKRDYAESVYVDFNKCF